jgi:hypothetical protein
MKKSTPIFKIFAVYYACLFGFSLAHAAENPQVDSSKREITKLSATEEGAGQVTVAIDSSGPIQYTAFKLNKPPKLILDLSDMQPGAAANPIVLNKGIVKTIRPLYFEESKVLRLEIELNSLPDYKIMRSKGNELRIHLAEAGNLFSQVEAGADNNNLQVPKSPIEETTLTDPAKSANSEDNETASDKISSLSEEDPCIPILAGVKEKITLDFQDADIINTLRLIAEVSGFNMIFGPGIEGKLNLRLVEVPWNEAFKIILANNKLGRECFGDNVVRVAPLNRISEENKTLVAVIESKKSAKEAGELVQPMETEVVKINNIDPSVFKQLIDDILKEMLSGADHSQVIADVRTRSIIITDVRPYIDQMLKVIKVLDSEVVDPNVELSKQGAAQLEEQKDKFPTIPVPVIEFVQQSNPKLFADVEYYENLFSDTARIGKMSAGEQTSAINQYRDLIEQVNSAKTAIISSPLQVPLESLRWVGSLLKTSGRVALVETEDKKGHIVKTGTLVGPNFGRVDSINESNVIVLESVRDFEGNIFSKKVKISYLQSETN